MAVIYIGDNISNYTTSDDDSEYNGPLLGLVNENNNAASNENRNISNAANNENNNAVSNGNSNENSNENSNANEPTNRIETSNDNKNDTDLYGPTGIPTGYVPRPTTIRDGNTSGNTTNNIRDDNTSGDMTNNIHDYDYPHDRFHGHFRERSIHRRMRERLEEAALLNVEARRRLADAPPLNSSPGRGTPLNSSPIRNTPIRSTNHAHGVYIRNRLTRTRPNSPVRPNSLPDDWINGIPCPETGTTHEAKAIVLSCVICQVNQIQTVNFPCMHACFCLDCVRPSIMHSNICPICRTRYASISMLYLSAVNASQKDLVLRPGELSMPTSVASAIADTVMLTNAAMADTAITDDSISNVLSSNDFNRNNSSSNTLSSSDSNHNEHKRKKPN